MEYMEIRVKRKFPKGLEVDEDKLVRVDNEWIERVISTRIGGDFEDNAIYLDNRYDWVLGKDSNGTLILVPLEKER